MYKQLLVAQYLVKAHRKEDPFTHTAKFLPDEQEVRIIEVSLSCWSCGNIHSVYYGPHEHSAGLTTAIILLSNGEWKDVQSGKLTLPNGWDLTKAMDI